MTEFRKCCVVGTNYAIASTMGDACWRKLTHGYGCVVLSAQISDCHSGIMPCGRRKDGMRAAGTNETQQDMKRAVGTAHTIAGGLRSYPRKKRKTRTVP